MKIFAVFLLVFVSTAALVRTLPTLSRICSGGDYEPSRPAFLFDAELTSEPGWRPFYFTWNHLYDYEWTELPDRHDDLIDEWSSYFGTRVTREELRKVIFDASPEDVERIRSFVRSPGDPATDPLLLNPFVRSLRDRPDDDFLTYLTFAKRCEPSATFSDYWDEDGRIEKHGDTMRALIIGGLSLYGSTTSPFFKLRYGYQVIRLAHYLGEYQRCVNLYATCVAPLNSTSPIAYWALEQKAGALRSLGQVAEAAHDFSVVFDRTESRKYPSYLSFRIESDSAWEAVIRLCANSHEKSVLHFLRGINNYNNALEEMENIYALEPSSGMLNTLLVREINRHEDRIYQMDRPYYADFSPSDEEGTAASLERLRTFLNRCVSEKKVKNIHLWRLADAYVESLLGNSDASIQKLSALRPVATDTLSLRSIDLILTAIDVERASTLTAGNEDKLFKRVLDGQHDKLLRFTINRFAKTLAAQGDSVKAWLCNNNISTMMGQMDLAQTDRVLSWLDHRKKTSFDEYLVDSRLANPWYITDYSRGGWDASGDAREKLLELKGTILASQHRFRDAIVVFEQRQGRPLDPLRANPFSARINCGSTHPGAAVTLRRHALPQTAEFRNRLHHFP